MFCQYCGKEIQEGQIFCANCGNKILQPTQNTDADKNEEQRKVGKPRSGKNKALIGILAGMALIAVCIGILLGVKNKGLANEYNKFKDQIGQDNIPAYALKLEEIESGWDSAGALDFKQKEELIRQAEQLADESKRGMELIGSARSYVDGFADHMEEYNIVADEYAEFERCIDALAGSIENYDVEKIKGEMEKSEEAYNTLLKAGSEYIKERLDEYRALDLDTAEANDIQTINSAMEALDGMLKDGGCAGAAEFLASADEVYFKYMEPAHPLEISVQQIDAAAYPRMKLYLKVADLWGNSVEHLEKEMFYIRKRDRDGSYVNQKIKAANQLNELEALNINMVVDVSDSMAGAPMYEVQGIMERFIRGVQFAAGDMVELTSFSNGVYIEQGFTNDANALISSVRGLYTQNMTAFYDALYTSVSRVASRQGAKCVIAFTDGLDNYSSCTANDVIALSQRYHVPIFIIGIGYDDYSTAQYIAQETGGMYYNAARVSDMNDIYSQIYRAEKQLYLIEFEDTSGIELFSESSIVAGYHTAEYGGEINYNYTPYMLVNVADESVYTSGPEAVVAAYMRAFAEAMTKMDYSFIAPYLKSGSAMEAQQRAYVTRGISEVIDSYEIEYVDVINSDSCVVTTRETYFVQKADEPLELLTQRCKYQVEKVGSDWKIVDFAESVEVLSRIEY